ncbi:hypothetical protein GY45DRAFT_1318324 [Cubamyces sp. BRFM 1775]|nr:hypothetical protein GY45DRAFT_1318324 [Cubamyces sp. BRFM 1775]
MAQSSQQTNGQSNSIQRDGNYWFNDGNLVLIAKNHDVGACSKGFRIHLGVLVRHSQVFKRFSEACYQRESHPEEADSTSSDCPFVRVDDSYHDIKALLRVLYDIPARSPPETPMPFSEAAALMRLGHEYEIPAIIPIGVRSLIATFSAKAVWSWHSVVREDHFTPVRALSKECIEAANLFRLTDCPGMRITALYACSAIDTKYLVRGVVRADGFVEKLPSDDLARCLKLRECMDARLTDYIIAILTLRPCLECQQPKACNRCIRQARPLRVFHQKPMRHNTLPRGFGPVFPDWTKNDTLCKFCRTSLAKRELAYREDLWHDLPTMLGLPIPKAWQDYP